MNSRINNQRTAPVETKAKTKTRKSGVAGTKAQTSHLSSKSLSHGTADEAKANAQAVIKVIEALGRATTVSQCIHAALDTVRSALGWAYGSFWQFSPETNDLRFAYESGVVNAEFQAVTKQARFTEGVGLSGRAWKSQELYFVSDLGAMKDCCRAPVAQKAGVRSGVCFPIFNQGTFIGTMDFFSLETLTLSEDRLNVLRAVGRLVSTSLERTTQEERRAAIAEDTAAVNAVLELLSKATTSAEVVRLALDTVRTSFHWAYGSYWKLDPKRSELRFAAESGLVNDQFQDVTRKAVFREGEGLNGRAWKTRELYFVSDIGDMTDCCRAPIAKKAGVRFGVSFPVFIDDQIHGTMDFFTTESLTLSPERLDTLRSVARLISNALNRISGVEKQVEAARDTIAVNRVLEVVAKARTAEEMIQSVLESVKVAFDWAYASFWKLDTKNRELVFGMESGVVNDAFRKVTIEAKFREGVGLSGRAWATKDLFFVEDIGQMKDCCRAPIAQAAGVKSGVCFPITMDDEVIGTMDFFTTETLAISQGRLESLRSVGKLVSSALERINYLERKIEDSRAVNSVLETVSRATTPDEAARLTIETVRSSFGWAYGSYWKVDPKAQKLKFSVEAGFVNEEFRRVTMEARFQEGEGLSGRAWRGRDLFFVQDLGQMKDCCRAPIAQKAGVKSGVAFPITMAGEVVGTMDFFALETLKPSQERLEALRNVGRLVSSAFERLEELQRSARNAESLSGIINKVTENAATLTSSSLELTDLSQQMARNADETASQANVVSAASEQVSQNIAVVAGGAKEMLASIQEISRSSSEAARVAHNAVSMADSANQTVSKLGDASNEIGQVIKVITSIAQQTNLLALNATIEAARAGEAGKGFAVVANEVKELAKQTASATEEIGRKIEAIQLNTRSAIDVIGNIGTIINQVSDISNTIASAVEQQTATTNEIGRNVSEAARGASEIAKNITGVAGSAQSTAEGSERSLHAAHAVQQMATQLSELVAQQTL